MHCFIREVWNRAIEENQAAEQTAEAQRRQSRRTERDRERMNARNAQQRVIDNESDEDITSAPEDAEFDAQSVSSEPVVDVDVEVSDSATRRGRGMANTVNWPTQRRRRGGSYGSSSSSVAIHSQEELLVNLIAIADRAFPAATAPTQMAPIAVSSHLLRFKQLLHDVVHCDFSRCLAVPATTRCRTTLVMVVDVSSLFFCASGHHSYSHWRGPLSRRGLCRCRVRVVGESAVASLRAPLLLLGASLH
jgi:hypothetical protein